MGIGHSKDVQTFVGQVLEKRVFFGVNLVTLGEGSVTHWDIIEIPQYHEVNTVASGKGHLVKEVLVELPDHIGLRIRVGWSVDRDNPNMGLLGAT